MGENASEISKVSIDAAMRKLLRIAANYIAARTVDYTKEIEFKERS